ncbi:hypothetical protein GTC054_51960 [Burkholderia pseudomallei]|nr:hypothetical protein GTC054_51960 [Burkholderia pseudomallei]
MSGYATARTPSDAGSATPPAAPPIGLAAFAGFVECVEPAPPGALPASSGAGNASASENAGLPAAPPAPPRAVASAAATGESAGAPGRAGPKMRPSTVAMPGMSTSLSRSVYWRSTTKLL